MVRLINTNDEISKSVATIKIDILLIRFTCVIYLILHLLTSPQHFFYYEPMDNNSKKSSPVRSVLSEIGIAALLVVLILCTLNYFRILPVSQSFPILSFLPQQPVNSNNLQLQTQEPNRNNIKTTVNSIVRPY